MYTLQNSPATSQMLVTSAEQATRILSKTLDNNTPKAIKARPNISNVEV